MKNISIRKNVEIIAPAAVVWDALTSPELIKKYMNGATATSEWKVGEPIFFEGHENGKHFREKGTILEMNRCKTFRYNYWSRFTRTDDKPENYVPITYSLNESKGVTTLTVSQENIADDSMKRTIEQHWDKVLERLKDTVESEMTSIHG